jgi:hypothetical protein
VFDQREELPLLPFGYPIGFVPASRGGVYIESIESAKKTGLVMWGEVYQEIMERVKLMARLN